MKVTYDISQNDKWTTFNDNGPLDKARLTPEKSHCKRCKKEVKTKFATTKEEEKLELCIGRPKKTDTDTDTYLRIVKKTDTYIGPISILNLLKGVFFIFSQTCSP